VSVSWLRLLIEEFAIIASCVHANAKKEVFVELTVVVGPPSIAWVSVKGLARSA